MNNNNKKICWMPRP